MKHLSFIAIVAVCLIGLATASLYTEKVYRQSFNDFAIQYSKKYSNIHEEERRFEVFKQNYDVISTHNLKPDSSWKMGINQWADLTLEEYTSITGTDFTQLEDSRPNYGRFIPTPVNYTPVPINWVTRGKVTPVVDVGQKCHASSYAAAIHTFETQNAIEHGDLNPLSIQEPIDCDVKSNRCYGSTPELVYVYTMRMRYGACYAKEYPYTGKVGRCYRDPCGGPYLFHYSIIDRTENAHLFALNNGTIAMQVAAGNDNWRFYQSGIVDDDGGDKTFTQFVTLVGYDVDQATGTPYLILKNCFGTTYGEEGYVRVAAGKELFGLGTGPDDAIPFMSWK